MPVAQEITTSQTLRAKPAVVFAVLLLAALQLTTATHQFDHTANDLGDVCTFCLQLDRLDDISVATHSAIPLSSANSIYVSFTSAHIDVRRQTFSQPRAPPLS